MSRLSILTESLFQRMECYVNHLQQEFKKLSNTEITFHLHTTHDK